MASDPAALLPYTRQVVFLVTGASKAEVVKQIMSERLGDEDQALPAARVRPKGDLVWLFDHEAAP